jgi:hypothetical protein
VTANRRPQAEQLVASANGAREATFPLARGGDSCHPACRLELPAGTGSRDVNNAAINLEEAAKIPRSVRDDGVKAFPDPTADRPLIDASRIPAAARTGARRFAGFRAAADKCTAISSSPLGLWGQ